MKLKCKNLMNKPLVSIVTICYNCEETIDRTIKSVLNQTYESIEYIIVDGASNDGTVPVIKSLLEGYSKKYILLSEPDQGIYDAMNKGIDLANGVWIIFMNAGDVFYDKTVIERLATNDYSPNVGIVYGDVELDFGKSGKLIKSLQSFDEKDVTFEICHQGMMTRTDILKKIKYDTSFRIMADLNSFKQIKDMGYKFEYIPITFATFQLGGISSSKPFLSLKESCRLHEVNKLSIHFFKSLLYAISRYCLQKLLSKDIYNDMWYKRINSLKCYKQK